MDSGFYSSFSGFAARMDALDLIAADVDIRELAEACRYAIHDAIFVNDRVDHAS